MSEPLDLFLKKAEVALAEFWDSAENSAYDDPNWELIFNAVGFLEEAVDRLKAVNG